MKSQVIKIGKGRHENGHYVVEMEEWMMNEKKGWKQMVRRVRVTDLKKYEIMEWWPSGKVKGCLVYQVEDGERITECEYGIIRECVREIRK